MSVPVSTPISNAGRSPDSPMTELDLSGNLSFLNLGELLQLVGSSGASGTLRVISPHRPEPGVIYMDKGNPINASKGTLAGIDALFGLFGWTEGRFEFLQEPIECEKIIKKGRMEIILDGLRLLDEGKIETVGPKEGEAAATTVEPAAAKPSRLELPPPHPRAARGLLLHCRRGELLRRG